MALELHIAGPGLDITRRLHAGDPALILGRDPECAVCLPDPDRNVSRRHLSLWNEADELHFHVLSVVNGVDLPAGEVPPGARGVVPVGESLLVSAYRVTTSLVADDAADPWEALEREVVATTPRYVDAGDTVPASGDEDPFGDWGFGSTFGPGSPGGPLHADALAAATDIRPFLAGLGIDPDGAPLSQGELETIGRLTRIALLGLMQALQAGATTRQDLRTEDRTMIGARETNPLKMDTPIESKLFYLFGGRAAGAGFASPDRAVAEIVAEVVAHQQAMAEGAREAVEGTVKDFDPDLLRARLIGTGAKLFESARAWDAFVKDYGEQKRHLTRWVQQLLDRHFAEAYTREFVRVKRDTSSRRR